MAKVIIACEESQIICKAFRDKGHEAYSCDLQNCSGGHTEWHIKDNILNHLNDGWDLMIGHPPCQYLSYAATKYWNEPGRVFKRIEALYFFAQLWEAPIDKICLENPKSCASPVITKYSQQIQPYYFGDYHLKTTWLWLKNLPKLKYTKENNLFENQTAVNKPEPIYTDYSGKKRYFTDSIQGQNKGGFHRSKTFLGIAKAMADQWSKLI